MGSFVADLFLLLMISTGHIYGVSFYGDGYIHLRTVEVSIQTLLHVRFRTSSQTGLLFLAAGRRDFLLLELMSGHLQVRLDLGSGEQLLRSEKGLHLRDLAWHSIELTHDHHNVTMTVDRNSHSSVHMPGPDLELSVEDGLFVGGAPGLTHPHLLNVSTGFRGCVDEVVFNAHNLLSSLRPYSGYKSIHEVSRGCSPEFSATQDDSVSFFSSKAFISLPPWEVLQEGVFECELHPSARKEDGMVLYSSGDHGWFVAIQIRDGQLVATVGKGDGNNIELHSQTHVHNYTWYHIQLHLLPHSVHMKVGEESIKSSLDLELQDIQLKGPLFLGGLSEEARGQARQAGLKTAVRWGQPSGGLGSFKGCLRAIRVNTQRTGIPHATITKDITIGCKTGQDPDADPTDRPEFDVTPTQPISHRKKNSNFLLLRKLEVSEGGRAPLEPKHLKVNLDFQKLGIHPSQLMFRIEGQPVHGQLRLDLSPDLDGLLGDGQERIITMDAEERDRTFSMLDLWQGRVMYVHGGSEGEHDFFMFSVFSNNKKGLPVFLKGNRLHRFDISITPVNDAPVLSLPEGNLFTLLENSKRQLTTDVLRVSDSDSSPAELVFSSLGNLNTELGHLEHQDYPGRAVNLFSLNDLEGGKISFVHTGVPTSRLALRVSDGLKLSNTVVLRIMAVPLEHKLVNNTGLVVNQGAASVITANHLAVQVNVANQASEIHYDVTELPQYGELQRMHSSGEWKPTTAFTQKLLEKERIRYVCTYHGLQTHNNISDSFKCKINIGSLATDEVVVLIAVRWIQFKVTRSKMEVNGVQTIAVTAEDLHAISKGVKLNGSDLYFRLLSAPKRGKLFLDEKLLQRNSTFSQQNITDGSVKYKLHNMPHEDARDTFSFQVFSTHASSTAHDFRINIKAESSAITILNKGLSILEGGSKVINKDLLFAHTGSNLEVRYSVTVGPRHGAIRRINLSNSTSINDNIVTFTNQDIYEERIMYVHDDSETKQDSFTFEMTVYKPNKHNSKTKDRNPSEHTFNISVQLVNDQRPVRVVDKVFHVARDGQRLVTLNDLRYRDDDSDFEDSWLVYTRRGIPMGDLVLATDTSHKLYEFTQRDLEQKKVLFVHRGVSFGRFVLFISDGKHYVSTLLEVMAQDPYLRAENNTGLSVQRGGVTTLTSANLSVFTNLDVRDPNEVTYEVFLPPRHGTLCFSHGYRETATEKDAISAFTQWDLLAGRLMYHHDGSHNLSDGFNVTARARAKSAERLQDRGRREVQLDMGVQVKIYLESHQRPPTVISNSPVVVGEGENVSISREHLEVVHEDSRPSEIVFTVQAPPTLGYIQRSPPKDQRSSTQAIRGQSTNTFTQEDLNRGLIVYHQQAPGNTNDSALLEATNGVTKVGPIRLDFDIVPMLLPLQVSDLTLDEGSSLSLTSDVIKVTNHHFTGMNFLYQVVVPPRHGHLEHSRIPGMPITAFTHTEVEREYISYIHDGSDTQRDNFTVVANQTEIRKHSPPCTAHINVTPVNDETPVVTTNKGLKAWAGSVTEITVADLRAEDLDTPHDDLEFVITPPSNGHLALKSAPSRHILNFTQTHIETGQLLFVHSGAFSGGFHFQVNDGVNFAPRQIFSTTARSLVLTLQRNHPLQVYPGSITPISELELKAITNDVTDTNRNLSVVFTVTDPPTLGRLARRMPDNSMQNVSTFTQGMVNDGVVVYDHTMSVEWSAADSFSFTVSSPPAFLPPRKFTILISYNANKKHQDNPQHKTRLLNNAGAVVAEGDSVIIDGSKLDASNLLAKVPETQRKDHQVLYRLVSQPRHGALSMQGNHLNRNQPNFSQVTLNKFGIRYIHDDSETTSDSFAFQAWVAPLDLSSSLPSDSSSALHSASSSSSLAVMETFNITVTPVNDQAPLIKSRAPSMKVVVGDRVLLGPDNLQVEDHDTPPEELHYLVISKPNNGYLTLGERPEPVTSFTQYDINHGRLHFIQQGEPSAGVFYFNITDGHHGPLYRLFHVEVIKPTVSMVNNTGLSLVQGRTAVVLTTEQLAAQTNSRSPANVTYTVTAQPRHGRIAINDQEVTAFRHQDLRFARVVYHMTDLSESEDSFRVSASASSPGVDYGNVTEQTVKVTVRPLVHLRESVRVPSGVTVKLGKAMIDASELARISRADPVFEVLSPPKHGKLVKITHDPSRTSESLMSESLTSFTFRDVVQGRVAIEETLSDGGNNSALATPLGKAPATPLNDSFVFLLRAGDVQPARGELHFTVLPHHRMRHGHRSSNKSHGGSHEHNVSTTRPPYTHNKTTSEKGGGPGAGSTTLHILPDKSQNRTHHHRSRAHGRWGNHTTLDGQRSGSGATRAPALAIGGGGGGGGGGGQSRVPPPPPANHPVVVRTAESRPRPASDPLLIILPLLSCLLLVVILVVLILVFRRRREKRAQQQLLLIQQQLQQVASMSSSPAASSSSPYQGRAERSVSVPSVVVTPVMMVGHNTSCPASPGLMVPVRPTRPRRRSLAPGTTFWGPVDEVDDDDVGGEGGAGDWNVQRIGSRERHVAFRTSLRSSTPTLKDNQYWV